MGGMNVVVNVSKKKEAAKIKVLCQRSLRSTGEMTR